MTSPSLVEQLMALPQQRLRQDFLQEHRSELGESAAQALKQEADRLLRSDVQQSLEVARLLVRMGDLRGEPHFQALGLLAEANARSIGGLGQYQEAVALYDQAAAIYRKEGASVDEAKAQIGKVFSLAYLGRYDEAIEAGRWAATVLEAHREWRPLATLTMNMAVTVGRRGEDSRALELFEQAGDLCRRLGPEGEAFLPLVHHNRAIVLRNLGRFEDSIAACQAARVQLERLGQKADAARAQKTLAFTYFLLGRYNEALQLLYQSRDEFMIDGLAADAMLVELDICACLLQLRRFQEVLEQSRRFQERFAQLGTRREVGQAILDEAIALAGLGQFAAALPLLDRACQIFAKEGYTVWMARVDLERALIQGCQRDHAAALETALGCAETFRQRNLPLLEAQARLVAGRAATTLGHLSQATELLQQVLDVGTAKSIPALTYQAHHLLGKLAETSEQVEQALHEYDLAIQELERLRGRLMVEYRAGFAEDKESLYEDIVRLFLATDQPERGLEYAERAKSRALVDLLAHRLDLGLRAKSREDEPLVEELVRLRAARDQLYRRWESNTQFGAPDRTEALNGQPSPAAEALALEKRITELWHQLLIRNADYAVDASLWQVRAEPVQPYLDSDTVLLEYFSVGERLAAFAVTRDAVHSVLLETDISQVHQLLWLWQLNAKAAPVSRPSAQPGLLANAQGVLRQLYRRLIDPLRDTLAGAARLVIVPHGPLHYLPFHALYDGQHYLIDSFELVHLPGASLLRYCSAPRPYGTGLLTVGHSHGGRLPYALHEAQAIADRFGGDVLLEEEANTRRLRAVAAAYRLVHVAAHGDFRPDNPLFSGIALADGWLTTLDIFSMRLNASLVTLSACQTGRTVVAGGDELLGLMRAFLYAGAGSLALTLWPVEDRSTGQLMELFYARLADGWTKAAALRHAQRQFIEEGYAFAGGAHRTTHPYFWAPFFLVGDGGAL